MIRRAIALAAALASFLQVTPALAAAEDVTGAIDAPSVNSVVAAGRPFTVSGWLVDRSARGWSGVEEVAISVKQPGQVPVALGSARIAQARPDVGAYLGDATWAASGYTLQAPGLTAGTYDLIVAARTPHGWISHVGTLRVGGDNPQPLTQRDGSTWAAHGFRITAPASVWPLLELLHAQRFDWALETLARRGTAIEWADLRTGVMGSFDPALNRLKLSRVLESTSTEARAAVLAHEATHVNDEVNGRLQAWNSDTCIAAETRAFVTEANFWQQLFGAGGKKNPDSIEAQANRKMWAFAGNAEFAELVVRTTPSYVAQCAST